MEKFLKTSLGKISTGKWLHKKGAAENKNAAEKAAANFSAGQGLQKRKWKKGCGTKWLGNGKWLREGIGKTAS